MMLTVSSSRRRLLPLRYPVVVPVAMLSAARRRRGIQTTLGFLVGLTTCIIVTSRLGTGLRNRIGSGSANGTCLGLRQSWSLPANPEYGFRGNADEDAVKSVGITLPVESVHNSRKTLLFVGVMTAQKYLATRARAVYETWGREIPGRIAFFTSATSVPPSNRPDLPIVRLRGVDDSYPPQKKSFLMLQYMWERYGDRYEWFLRADDDVYVRPDR